MKYEDFEIVLNALKNIYKLTDFNERPLSSMYDLEMEMANINTHCEEVLLKLKIIKV